MSEALDRERALQMPDNHITALEELRDWLLNKFISPETVRFADALSTALTLLAEREWRPIETCPAPEGYIDDRPQFFAVAEVTHIRYAHDEGEAIAIVRSRLIEDAEFGSHWQPFAWLSLPAAPQPPKGETNGNV